MSNTKHRSQIGNLTVASASPYIVYGEVRGLVSEHHLLRAAQQSRERDRDACSSLPGGNRRGSSLRLSSAAAAVVG